MTDVESVLASLLKPGRRTAILGVGNELCRDDDAGMRLVSRIRPWCEGKTLLAVGGGSAPENFTGVIRAFSPQAVVVFDAARMGLSPGEAAVLDSSAIAGAEFSTHMLPLPVTLSYLEASCGCASVFVGIEPASTQMGTGLDPRVEAGVERLAETIRRLIS